MKELASESLLSTTHQEEISRYLQHLKSLKSQRLPLSAIKEMSGEELLDLIWEARQGMPSLALRQALPRSERRELLHALRDSMPVGLRSELARKLPLTLSTKYHFIDMWPELHGSSKRDDPCHMRTVELTSGASVFLNHWGSPLPWTLDEFDPLWRLNKQKSFFVRPTSNFWKEGMRRAAEISRGPRSELPLLLGGPFLITYDKEIKAEHHTVGVRYEWWLIKAPKVYVVRALRRKAQHFTRGFVEWPLERTPRVVGALRKAFKAAEIVRKKSEIDKLIGWSEAYE